MATKENGADFSEVTAADLVAQHLTKPKETARAYRYDLQALGRFLNLDIDGQVEDAEIQAVVRSIVSQARGVAQMTIDRYIETMKTDEVPLNTIRRRVASTLSLLTLAHKYDVITWSIKVKLPASKPVKDTSGPGIEAVRKMFDVCRSRDDAKGIRDSALMSLLYYHALRRAEAVSPDLSDFDQSKGTLAVKAKGKHDRVIIPLIPEVVSDLVAWIEERGDWSGPLFTSCNPNSPKGTPLTDKALYKIVVALGRKVGVVTSPHGIRHTATSELLRLTNGNLRIAQALTRHTDPRTLMQYDDDRRNLHRQGALILKHARAVYSPIAQGVDNL